MKKVRLGDYLRFKRGTTLPGKYYATSGKYKRLTLGNFDFKQNIFKENTSKDNIYFSGSFKEEFLLEGGDVITPLTEQVRGLLGSTARIPKSGSYILSQDVAKVESRNNGILLDYAYYLIPSDIVRKQLDAGSQQTKIRHTSVSKLEDLVAYIPSLDEQEQTANLLTGIDELYTNLQSQIAELEQTAQDLYDYWFVQFDFPDENGNPYRSSGGKMVWNDQLKQEIPAGWRVASLDELSCQASKSISARKLSDQIVEHYSIPAYDKDCFPEISVGSTIKSSKTIVRAGDILVSKLNPRFQRIWLPMTSDKLQVCSTEFIAVRPNHPSLRSLLNRVAKSRRFYETLVAAATSSTGSRSRVNPEVIFSFKFACNDDMTLLSAFSSHDERIEVLRKQKQELVRLRDTLLPLLLNGQAAFRLDRTSFSETDVW